MFRNSIPVFVQYHLLISLDSVQVRFLAHPKTTSLALAHVHNMATLALKLSGRSLLYSKSASFPHPHRPAGQHPRASRRHSASTHHSSYTSQRRATTAVPSPQTVLRSEFSDTTKGVTPGLVICARSPDRYHINYLRSHSIRSRMIFRNLLVQSPWCIGNDIPVNTFTRMLPVIK